MFAVTERLLLRPGWAEDAPALSRTIADESVVHNLARVPWPYALGDAERFLSSPQAPKRPSLLIFLRDCARLIGGVGLAGDEGETPELGYWIASDQWGKGYATEAGQAVVAMADESLRLPAIRASHAVDNPASGRVLAKLGFRPEGMGRLHSLARRADMEVKLFARERNVPEAARLAA